ncbi:MAG: YjbQ family protein [Anaerolineales bacterium]|nr:YjbQ family protein [Anaerolineales bacterium]
MLKTKLLEVFPGEGFAVQNITRSVMGFVSSTGVNQGQLIAFFKHTTGSIIIGEHEAGIIADLHQALEMISPENGDYLHHLREVDFNGWAHIRTAIMPTSVIIPISDGKLVLGTHQEILVVDSQPEELPRYVFLQVQGVEE